ncbi:hypothetical protein H4Q26_000917 [Puccinia striiformis f. sp. tritici PST-130]|nr:hypothetical protein H4Q26_000917 [Puccinia striiformis f. sp. tritici PST-130]
MVEGYQISCGARTQIEDIDRVALQTRITDGTIVLRDKRANRTLTVSEIKGSDSAIIVCALEYPEVNPGAPTPKTKHNNCDSSTPEKKNSYLRLIPFSIYFDHLIILIIHS